MTHDFLFADPPLLTADLPGIGGRIKSAPEDFEVEEIPAYEPCGEGDFLYLWLEKRDMSAEYFVRQIAKRLAIAQKEIGTAGLKDRHAVTRQMVSVPAAAEDNLAQLDGDGIRLLNVNRHTNKLKPGHLRGNRFRIVIRDVEQNQHTDETVAAILTKLRQSGMPNFYGPQRFGHDGETGRMGMAMLGDQADGRSGPKSPFLRRLALSAAQSLLFNAYLARRLTDDLLAKVLPGDVMSKWPAGGLFTADDVPREQQRFDARETVTTGPIFGRKTFAARAEAAKREQAILQAVELQPMTFSRFGKLAQGTRRHNLVYLDDLEWLRIGNNIQLTFSLPSGSYATVLLREVIKRYPAVEPNQ